MDFLFLILIVALLLIFGYAQLQRGTIKIPGRMTLDEYDENSSMEKP